MALDSQKIDNSGKRAAMLPRHSVATSKMYVKIIVGLFMVLSSVIGYVVSGVYSEFVSLQSEVELLHYQLEEIKTEVKLLLEPILHERMHFDEDAS